MAAFRYRATGMVRIARSADLGVLLVAAALLAGGWALRSQYVDCTTQYRGLGITLEHPDQFSVLEQRADGGAGRAVVLSDVLVSGSFKPQIQITSETLPAKVSEADLLSFLLLDRQRQCNLFHVIAQRRVKLGRHMAWRLDYAHAVNPADCADDPAATDLPVVVRASSLAVLDRRRLVRVEVWQTAQQQQADPALARQVLDSVQVP